MSAELIGAIDRAVLELPEDLQIIWLRFRARVLVGYEFERPPDFLGVRLSAHPNYPVRADVYHPQTVLKGGHL